MTDNSSNAGGKREAEEILEDEPQSKRGTQGRAAHGGDRAGPNSADSGRTIAPQKGNPRADDRGPN